MTAVGGKWQFWIDRGGTFTDVVALSPEGRVLSAKLLSENTNAYDDAAIEGISRLLGLRPGEPIPPGRIAAVKIGTTVTTNALLERRGAPTLLVITHGFEDQLEIGTQARRDIFARRIVKPGMLYTMVAGARERVRADGTVEQPLDVTALTQSFLSARSKGIDAAAIVFMHAYAFPEHERQAAALAREMGFSQVSASHEVSPLIALVGRGDTTVADAYLSPVLRDYAGRVESRLAGQANSILLMASSGGLKPASQFRGCDAILSGPAGGVIAMAGTAKAAGFDRVIGFDMGGTSTDVSHFAGSFERTFEAEVAGVRLRVPMLSVTTIAAGGGSILTFDGARFRAGPDSAGSNPGPMCYRRGGPLTLTDANVLTGKIRPEHFPRIFGPSQDQPIDIGKIRKAFAALGIQTRRSAEEVADGFIRIAVENMANAIKKISVMRGYDVTRYVLNCFGSAGGQHACLIADTLGIEKILITPLSGLLSAVGIGIAPVRAGRQRSVERPLGNNAMASTSAELDALVREAVADLVSQGIEQDSISITRTALLKYEATETALPVEMSGNDVMRVQFEQLHRAQFGFLSPEKSVLISAIEVEAIAVQDSPLAAVATAANRPLSTRIQEEAASFYSRGQWHTGPIEKRENLGIGAKVKGPALVIEPHQTVVVEDGWGLEVTPRGDLLLSRAEPRVREKVATQADPVLLEVFGNLFMSIAEQMGEALRATAQSVNIRERLDFSCAIFDADGRLVANAPHVPVHLGSMDKSVETVIRDGKGTLRPGDVYMLNAPYDGGTHLPDITVVTPVFRTVGATEANDEVLFYVASRGHHADIGGLTPGSMSPRATRIEEEGVYIDTFKLVDAGTLCEAQTRRLLESAAYPARNPDQNIADLKAQVAANARGVTEIRKMIAHFGLGAVQSYMGHVQDAAETAVRRLITKLEDGHARIEMDQGTAIEVRISVDRQRGTAKIDFTGTSAQQDNNFNAPEPVTRAAVLYVIRVMVDEAIPMNAGFLRPVEIIIPDGSMLRPRYPAAVVAGNTETSQVITNALFAAFGYLSCSQGTMNNLTFGNERVQYYETICSGSPAGPGFDGTAAVQVHMTNTRLTDPEVLELRYPVVLEEFSIRRGSGGLGTWRSGDGTRRVIRFLDRMTCAILSGYRRIRPPGLMGGCGGQKGKNLVRRSDGTLLEIAGCSEAVLNGGDAIIVETPTGGGFGGPM